nr:hypothetical protein [uncultured Prevotella sp.]
MNTNSLLSVENCDNATFISYNVIDFNGSNSHFIFIAFENEVFEFKGVFAIVFNHANCDITTRSLISIDGNS